MWRRSPTRRSALGRARALGPVLVTGSLYLLADLSRHASRTRRVRQTWGAPRSLRLRRVRRWLAIVGHLVRRGLHNREADPMTISCSQATRSAESTTSSTRETWYVIRNIAIFFVVVFWLAVAFWVFKDARRRIDDSVARRARDAARALPAVPRRARLHALPAARVPRGRARARARDQGDGGAAQPARQPVPRVPRERRSDLPRVPGVHDAAEASVRELQRAARGALAGLPVLRDARRVDGDGLPRRRGATAPAPRRSSSSQ